MIQISSESGSVRFAVRVVPRARRDAIDGEWQGALKVRLAAPPVEGRANDALCRFLAACLKIPASAVRIVSGERGRTKRVEVRGVSAGQIRALAGDSAPGRHPQAGE
jgi:uncharacterized protein (TIGR00251 family)